MTTARQPTGIPTGGEFAPTAKAPSGVSLPADAPAASQVVLSALETCRLEAEEAQHQYENASARAAAETIRAAFPDAARAEIKDLGEAAGDLPGAYSLVGLYARPDGGRLPVPDADLRRAFLMSGLDAQLAGLQPGSAGADRYMDRDSKLLGDILDIDKALKLPVTFDERMHAEAQPVVDAILKEHPNAVALNFLSSDYDNGRFLASDEVQFQRPDGTWESWSAYDDDLIEKEHAQEVANAVAEMNALCGSGSDGYELRIAR